MTLLVAREKKPLVTRVVDRRTKWKFLSDHSHNVVLRNTDPDVF